MVKLIHLELQKCRDCFKYNWYIWVSMLDTYYLWWVIFISVDIPCIDGLLLLKYFGFANGLLNCFSIFLFISGFSHGIPCSLKGGWRYFWVCYYSINWMLLSSCKHSKISEWDHCINCYPVNESSTNVVKWICCPLARCSERKQKEEKSVILSKSCQQSNLNRKKLFYSCFIWIFTFHPSISKNLSKAFILSLLSAVIRVSPLQNFYLDKLK